MNVISDNNDGAGSYGLELVLIMAFCAFLSSPEMGKSNIGIFKANPLYYLLVYQHTLNTRKIMLIASTNNF